MTVTKIQFAYGDYVHPHGEVYPQIIEMTPVYSDRGYRWATDVRMVIQGSFCRHPSDPLTPALVNGMIQTLENAYQHDYKDFGFLIDGVPSKHFYTNDHPYNLSGCRVLSKSWRYQTPTELANTRSFNISLGLRMIESYSEVIEFYEQISLVGTGGPRWNFQECWIGPPVREDISEQTPCEIIQRGRIVTLTGLAAANPPWWPDYEHQPDRVITRRGPRLWGHNDFTRRTHYGLEYSYLFKMPDTPNKDPAYWAST